MLLAALASWFACELYVLYRYANCNQLFTYLDGSGLEVTNNKKVTRWLCGTAWWRGLQSRSAGKHLFRMNLLELKKYQLPPAGHDYSTVLMLYSPVFFVTDEDPTSTIRVFRCC